MSLDAYLQEQVDLVELDSTIADLKKMKTNQEYYLSRVKYKRSWRPSEKAATEANYIRQIKALNNSINILTELKQRLLTNQPNQFNPVSRGG